MSADVNLEAIIGLEIHIQLKTQSKMFCACPNVFSDAEPNSAICPICLGYPGTLPVPNDQAIAWTQKMGLALNCEIARTSKFDRKQYFYPDLPKGYQISQYDVPFCGAGGLVLHVEGQERTVGITRIHLEEDAAKNTHADGATLVDYNRAGTPLIEIVTEPDIRTPAEAKLFLQELQRIARTLGVSDADMEKAQLRCDANVSLREQGSEDLHPKTEVKNLNSFRFVERALEYEIERQTKAWEKGETPDHTTRGYDSDAGKTYAQRTKEEAADYRYFPEPDIPPFTFTEEDIGALKSDMPELPSQRRERFARQYDVHGDLAELLISEEDLGFFFENVVSELKQLHNERVAVSQAQVPELVTAAAKLITREIRSIMYDHGLSYEQLRITPENFAELVVLVDRGKVGTNAVRQVLDVMQRTGGDPDPIIDELDLEQVSGEDELEQYVNQVIEENPDVVEKIRGGKDGAIQFLMGQVMAKSGGKADPKIVTELLRKKIRGS